MVTVATAEAAMGSLVDVATAMARVTTGKKYCLGFVVRYNILMVASHGVNLTCIPLEPV